MEARQAGSPGARSRARLVLGLALLTVLSWAGEFAAAATPAPAHLRDTGLYADGSMTRVRAEHLSFSPQYPLWSDGALKRRWISLPPGTFMDAAQPDAWEFPVGTRLWKEFGYDGHPVETRYIERLADGSWRFATYVWDEGGNDAWLAPEGGIPAHPAARAPGGRYDFPAQSDCRACHEGARAPVLGFSALQLSPARDPNAPHGVALAPADVDLRSLVARGLLRNLPAAMLETPPRIAARSALERATLGYLHGNCGHCHSGTDAAPPVDLVLAQLVADPASVARARRSMLAAPSVYRPAGFDTRPRVVAPGHPAASVLAARMRSRDPQVQMPPVGTRLVDDEGLALVERWILSLTPATESLP